MDRLESAKWHAKVRLLKYDEDISEYKGREEEFHSKYTPKEVVESEGNMLLKTGINKIWDLVAGKVSGDSHDYSTGKATIGVGDDDTAAGSGDTDLKAVSNKAYADMDSGYPTSGTAEKIVFRGSFGAGDANFAWKEWVVKQKTSSVCLNRKAENLGTKTGGSWTLEVTITLS